MTSTQTEVSDANVESTNNEFELPKNVPLEHVVNFDMFKAPLKGITVHDHWLSNLRGPGKEMVWSPHNGGHWVATSGKLVNEILTDYKRFSSRQVVPMEGGHHDFLPTHLDPPEHRIYRMTLNDTLAPKKIKGMEGDIRGLVVGLIESFRTDGKCCFTTDFAEKFPIRVFLDMMDLPMEHFDFLMESAEMLFRPQGPDDFSDAYDRLWGFVEPIVEQRKGKESTKTDIATVICNSEVEGRSLTDREAVELVTQVLAAGMDSVVNFISYVMLCLAQNPERRRELVNDPGLIPAAAEELLRRFPLVSLCRVATQDMEFGGVQLKEGEKVLAPTMMYGLDERENECPFRVDFHRSVSMHSTFGAGAHKCPGQHLARTEVAILLQEWLKRIPDFEVANEVEYTSGILGTIPKMDLKWDPASTNEIPA